MSKRKPNTEEIEPTGLEIRVSQAWVRVIRFCQTEIPHGQLCIKIANGQPTDLVEEHTKRRIRFDKEETVPAEFTGIKF